MAKKKFPGCLILYESKRGDDKYRSFYLSEKTRTEAWRELNSFDREEGQTYKILRVIRLSDLPNGAGEAEALSRLLTAIQPNWGNPRDPWSAMVELIELGAKAWEETS